MFLVQPLKEAPPFSAAAAVRRPDCGPPRAGPPPAALQQEAVHDELDVQTERLPNTSREEPEALTARERRWASTAGTSARAAI